MADDEVRGRLSMGLHPKSYFEGPNAVQPFDGEMCYDDTTYDIYIFIQKDGLWHLKSRTKEIQDYLEQLKNSGIFTSAAAFVNNRKIYRFYFDQVNGVVRLDPELRFDPLYKYYAIREIDTDVNGGYKYVTGIDGLDIDNNSVISSLVNMDEEVSESGDGEVVSVPQIGGIITHITSGNSYVVEFYNSSRELVNILTFQAIAVRTADFDLCPDTAVTDMYITTNQAYDAEGDACYLYRNQNPTALEIETRLKYADGRTRSVSFEETVGGRLSIVGLSEINTDSITGANDDPQEFEIVYQLVRSNASLPNSSTSTETGAILSPSSLTISKRVKVYIIEDVYNDLVKLIPAAYIKQISIGNYEIALKYFGQYSNGAVNDITNIVKLKDGSTFVKNSFGVTQTLIVQVPYGNAGELKEFTFSLFAPEPTNDNKKVIINGLDTRYITFDQTSTGGGIYSGKFTGFKAFSETSGQYSVIDYATMIASMGYLDHVPTHIRVRDVIDPTYVYTDIADASSGVYFNVSGTGHDITRDRALLIEFYEIQTDDGGNAISVFATGALVHYASIST